jgi:hypothetical protein
METKRSSSLSHLNFNGPDVLSRACLGKASSSFFHQKFNFFSFL